MNENMMVYEKVREVPKEALKAINGGRLKGMSDINPMWRIKMLTEMFGICGIGWKTEIVEKRLEKGSGDEVVCFVDINLYVKVDGEWSAPIPGMGGSSFVTQERNGLYTSDECFKMAYTDAISVACKSLGFAADVYFANDRTKYSNQEEGSSTPAISQNTAQNGSGQRQTFQPSRTTQPAASASTGQSGKSAALNHKSRAINLMNEMKWDWNTLGTFASDVLERKIGKVLQDIKSEDEWKKVADAMEVTKAAMTA